MNRTALRKALLAAAETAMRHAHAPYSRYRVGAAVCDESGRITAGCNVENVSYGLTVCAERNAVAAAVAAGAKRITAAAVVASGSAPPFPCGACRQVLAEFAGPETPVWIRDPGVGPRIVSRRLGALLPDVFGMDKGMHKGSASPRGGRVSLPRTPAHDSTPDHEPIERPERSNHNP